MPQRLFASFANAQKQPDVSTGIFPKGKQGAAFIGKAWNYALMDGYGTCTSVICNVYFEPGARSNWHAHRLSPDQRPAERAAEKRQCNKIVLYTSNFLILFCKTLPTSCSYTRIGRVNDVLGACRYSWFHKCYSEFCIGINSILCTRKRRNQIYLPECALVR